MSHFLLFSHFLKKAKNLPTYNTLIKSKKSLSLLTVESDLFFSCKDCMDFEHLVKEILEKIDDLDEDGVKDLQRIFAKEHKMKTLPSKSQIIETYLKMIEQGEIEKNERFEHLLRKRAIRSLSGIVSVQVLTKPRPCP